MNMRFACVFAAFAGLASAQLGSVSGPSAGYVFDPSVHAVRQIRGIAGAATMGDPLDLGLAVAGAEISPRGDLAIALAGDRAVHLFRLASGAASEVRLANLNSAPTAIAFSPGGTAAVLYRAGAIQVLRGLPDAPEIAASVALTGRAEPEMAAAARVRRTGSGAIAVSDDGSVVLVARDSSVDLILANGGMRKLSEAQVGGLVAFAPRTRDAAVLTGGSLTVFQDVTGAATRQSFPGASAAALAFSADGAKLLMAGARGVTILDRATGQRTQTACECKVEALSAMGSLFRLNAAGQGPLWLLDTAQAEPRVVFVPAR